MSSAGSISIGGQTWIKPRFRNSRVGDITYHDARSPMLVLEVCDTLPGQVMTRVLCLTTLMVYDCYQTVLKHADLVIKVD